MFPAPTHAPRMPWYLPRSLRDTVSDTIIMVRDVMPPLATPARPRKTYSMVELTERPHSKSLMERRARAERKMILRPGVEGLGWVSEGVNEEGGTKDV